MKRDKCINCNGQEEVSVSIPCPECVGDGTSELLALRELAKWVTKNFRDRSRPPEDGLKLLTMVLLSQGKIGSGN